MSWFSEKTPEVAKAFAEMRTAVYKDGALDVRTKGENPTNSKNRFSNLMYISKHTTKITKILHQKFGDGN